MRSTPSLYALAGAALCGLGSLEAAAQTNVLSPSDAIIAIDANRTQVGNSNTGGEGPQAAFDNSDTTKWFTGGRAFSGLIVTPSAPAAVKSLTFTAGNDSANRDPVSYLLYGTNESITTPANGTGLENNWTLLGGGSTNLNGPFLPETTRNTSGAPSDVSNSTAYSSYKVLFRELRRATALPADPVTFANASVPNGLQISEVRMFTGPGGTGTNVGAAPTSVVPFDQTDSFYPLGERPAEAIDGIKTSGSKHLNFGREGAGLIITPASGPKAIDGFQITTGNDSVARDPASYIIYGTNSPIASLEHSDGTSEAWTELASGPLSLPGSTAIPNDQRNVDGPLVAFVNDTLYSSYKIVFPTIKGTDNSVQFSEIAMFENTPIPEPTSLAFLGAAGAAMGMRRRTRRT